MSKASASTTAAIVTGAALGAIAAMLAKKPERIPESYPRDPASLAAPASAAESSPAPLAPASEAPAPPAPSEARAVKTNIASSASPEASDLSLASAEQGCARRVARSCLSAAEFYESGHDVHADPNKARLYRVIAVSILDEHCTARDPESCNELASLYASGTGVPESAETSQALMTRARELCAGRDTAFCSALAAGETH